VQPRLDVRFQSCPQNAPICRTGTAHSRDSDLRKGSASSECPNFHELSYDIRNVTIHRVHPLLESFGQLRENLGNRVCISNVWRIPFCNLLPLIYFISSGRTPGVELTSYDMTAVQRRIHFTPSTVEWYPFPQRLFISGDLPQVESYFSAGRKPVDRHVFRSVSTRLPLPQQWERSEAVVNQHLA
jgi:hypothetical protein